MSGRNRGIQDNRNNINYNHNHNQPRVRTNNEGLRVVSERLEVAEEDEEKVYFSDYFITVSTNIRPTDDDDEYDLRMKLDDIMENEVFSDHILDMVVDADSKGRVDPSLIKEVKYSGLSETGSNSRGKRTHWHGYVKIQHFTKLRLWRENVVALLDGIFKERFGARYKNLYYRQTWVPSSAPIARYIAKSLPRGFQVDRNRNRNNGYDELTAKMSQIDLKRTNAAKKILLENKSRADLEQDDDSSSSSSESSEEEVLLIRGRRRKN